MYNKHTVTHWPIIGIVDIKSALQQDSEYVDELEVQFGRSFGRVYGREVKNEFVQRVTVLRRIHVRAPNVETRLHNALRLSFRNKSRFTFGFCLQYTYL